MGSWTVFLAPNLKGEATSMLALFAHMTRQEIPSLWLVACGSFAAGAAVTYAILWARKVK
jgi:hypothetical protein